MLKNVLVFSGGLIALSILNQYVVAIYGYSFMDYWQWLIAPSEHSYFEFDEFIISAILIVICLLWFLLIMNMLASKLLGKKYQYIYLGNSKIFYGQYCAPHGIDKTLKTAISETEYNYSFNEIGCLQSFTQARDRCGLGQTSQQLSYGNMLAFFVAMMLFFIPLMGTLHASFAAMSADNWIDNNGKNIFAYQWEYSFDIVMASIGLSKGKLFGLWAFSLFLMLFLFSKYPRQAFGPRYLSLPSAIMRGAKLKASPINMSMFYERVSVKEFDKRTTQSVETSKRNITFQFSDLFKWPIYVTAVIEVEAYSGLEEDIQKFIDRGQAIDIKLIKGLKVRLANSFIENYK